MIPLVPLQKAIYDKIVGHAVMQRWLDVVVVADNPRGDDAPLVQLGLFYQFGDASSYDDEPMYAGTFQVRVHTPTSWGGTMKLAELLSDLDTALQSDDLTLDGWRVVVPLYLTSISTAPSRDEATRNPTRLGVLEYTIQVEALRISAPPPTPLP